MNIHRTSDQPDGIHGLGDADLATVRIANDITRNTFRLATALADRGIPVSVENPQSSVLHP